MCNKNENAQLQIYVSTSWINKKWGDIKRGDLYRYADEPEKVHYALDVSPDGQYVWAKDLIDPRELKETVKTPKVIGIKKKDNIGYNIHKEYKIPKHVQDIKDFLDRCERLLK